MSALFSRERALRLTGLWLLAVAATWTLLHRDAFQADVLVARLSALGGWAPLAFVLVYAVATILLVPGSVLTIAGGAIFGPVLGALLSLVGATMGATGALLLARYLASDLVARRTGSRLTEILDGVERQGWRFVALVRLVPLLPFNALNYALGLTPVRLGPFVVTSLVCMVPGAFVYAYLGHAGRAVSEGQEGSLKAGLVALSLLAILTLVPTLLRHGAHRGMKGSAS